MGTIESEAIRKLLDFQLPGQRPATKEIRALKNLPVPFAALTSYRDCPGRVSHRYADLVENAVRRLAERGARRVAVISHIVPEAATETTSRQDVSHFYEVFAGTAAALGLKTRPEWVIHPPPAKAKAEIERFGYEAMKALWSRPARPDGLFIFPHTAARGSLTALLELGVKIPGELQLVAHGNIETPILTPCAVDWITTSSREIVQALVAQIQCALDGHPVRPAKLKHRPAW